MAKTSNKSTEIDVTKTGPQSYRNLQRANNESFNTSTSSSIFTSLQAPNSYVRPSDTIYEGYESSPMQLESKGKDYWGRSMWDNHTANEEEWNDLSEIRAENQPWYAQAAAGIAKGVITAGTTFASGIAGIPYGIYQSIAQGDISKIWDNEITNGAAELTEEAEEWLPNYYTREQQEGPWYSSANLLSANFIFDKVVKNIGFTVGAAYSGGIYSSILNGVFRGAGAIGAFLKTGKRLEEAAELGARALSMKGWTRTTKALIGAGFSALGEGAIEAINNSKDYVNIERQKIDALTAENYNNAFREFIVNGGKIDENGNPLLDDSNNSRQFQAKLQDIEIAKQMANDQIDATRTSMGNADLLANLPILTAGNWLTFGKMFAGGYKASRTVSGIKTRATKEAMKAAKEEGEEAVKRLNNIVKKAKKTGYQGLTAEEKALVEEGTSHILGNKTYAFMMAAREPLKEGNEEMAQSAAAKASENYYGSRVDAIYDAALNPDSRNQVLNAWQASVQGFKDIYGNFNNYEEGFIGALTGLLGSPTFGKKNNSTSETYLGKSKWIGLSGGVIPQWRNAIKGRQEEAELVSHINSILKSGNLERDIKHLIAQTTFDNRQKVAAIRGDKLDFKDSELASIFENIIYLKAANKLDLLENAIKTMDDFDEEDAKKVLEYTTSEIGINSNKLDILNKKLKQLNDEKDALQSQIEEDEQGLTEYKASLTPLTLQMPYNEGNSALSQTVYSDEEELKIRETETNINKKRDRLNTLSRSIENTEKEKESYNPTTVSPYLKSDGSLMSAEEVLEDLNERASKYKDILNFVTNTIDSIDAATSEVLTNDQLKTLTWYKTLMYDWNKRADNMSQDMIDVFDRMLNSNEISNFIQSVDDELQGIDPNELNAQDKIIYGGLLAQKRFLKDRLKELTSVKELLSNIVSKNNNSGLALARALANDKETTIGKGKEAKKVKSGDYLYEFLKNLVDTSVIELSEDEKIPFINTLNDLKKIGENYNTYNKLLKEYILHPEKIDEAHNNSTAQAEAENNKRKRAEATNNVRFDSTTGAVANDIRKNKDSLGEDGIDGWFEDLTEEQKAKVDKANKLIKGIDGLTTLAGEDEALESLLNAAINKHIDEVNTLEELLDKLKKDGHLEEDIDNLLDREVLDDAAKLDRKEELEAAFRDFINSDEVNKLADSLEAQEKANQTKFEENLKKQADATDEEEEKQGKGALREPKEKKTTPPKEKRTENKSLADKKKENKKNKKKKENTKNEKEGDKKNTVEEDKKEVENQGSTNNIAKRNERRRIAGYSTAYSNRPQLSEVFMYGRNLESYVNYIKEHPERIPKFIVSKLFPNIKNQKDFNEAYIKYIEATHKYLTEQGAFDYVKHNLKANDELIFTVDKELNEAAGVPIVVIKAVDSEGNYHVVGTMKTELDFMSINFRTDKTYGETERAQKALYDDIVTKYKNAEQSEVSEGSQTKDDLIHITNTYNGLSHLGELQEWSRKASDIRTKPDGFGIENGLYYFKQSQVGGRGGDNITVWFRTEPSKEIKDNIEQLLNSSKDLIEFGDKVVELINNTKSTGNKEFIGNTSTVSTLMGGDVAFSDNNSTVSRVFEGTGDNIVFGVVREESGNLVIRTGNSEQDKRILNVHNGKKGQVYVLIPSNNGSLLPALCYGTSLLELLSKDNDWYIDQIIKAIQDISTKLQDSSNKQSLGALKANLAKWLGVNTDNLHINLAFVDSEGKTKETINLTEADRITIKYSLNSSNDKIVSTVLLNDDKTISKQKALNAVTRIIQEVAKSEDPELQVNLNFTELAKDSSRNEYNSNMAKYYHTNIVQGQTHTVNDWFTYDKTDVEEANTGKTERKTRPTAPPPVTRKPRPTRKVSTRKGTVEVSNGGLVTNEEGKTLVDEEKEKAVEEESKVQEESKETSVRESESKDDKKDKEDNPSAGSIKIDNDDSSLVENALLGGRKRKSRKSNNDNNEGNDDNSSTKTPSEESSTKESTESTQEPPLIVPGQRKRKARTRNRKAEDTNTEESKESQETQESKKESTSTRETLVKLADTLFADEDGNNPVRPLIDKMFALVDSNKGIHRIVFGIKDMINIVGKVITPTFNTVSKIYNHFIANILENSEREQLEHEVKREWNVFEDGDIMDKIAYYTINALPIMSKKVKTFKSKALPKLLNKINNVVKALSKNPLVTQNFFNRILAYSKTITNTVADSSKSKLTNLNTKYDYKSLISSVKDLLTKRGITEDSYNQLSPEQQEALVRCMI